MRYVYPKLFGKDIFFIRLGGNGLANCMFVVARSAIIANNCNAILLRPTWERFSPSNYIRKEKDKRTYRNLFIKNNIWEIKKKICALIFKKHYNEIEIDKFKIVKDGVIIIEDFNIGTSFELLIKHYGIVKSYFDQHICPIAIDSVNKYNFKNTIALHIRLGDYFKSLQKPISWYMDLIAQIQSFYPRYNFILFSDGTDYELKDILNIKGVRRVFFGNALADIIAMSKCDLIIGSDSSFSAWAAYLGQTSYIVPSSHLGNVLKDLSKQYIENHQNEDLNSFLERNLNFKEE